MTRIRTVRPQRRFSLVASWPVGAGSACVGMSSMCRRLLEGVVGGVCVVVVVVVVVVVRVVDGGAGGVRRGCWGGGAARGGAAAGGGSVVRGGGEDFGEGLCCSSGVVVGRGNCSGGVFVGNCWSGGAVVAVGEFGGAFVGTGSAVCGRRHTDTVTRTERLTPTKHFIATGPVRTRTPQGPPGRRRRTGSAVAVSRTATSSSWPPGWTR